MFLILYIFSLRFNFYTSFISTSILSLCTHTIKLLFLSTRIEKICNWNIASLMIKKKTFTWKKFSRIEIINAKNKISNIKKLNSLHCCRTILIYFITLFYAYFPFISLGGSNFFFIKSNDTLYFKILFCSIYNRKRIKSYGIFLKVIII